VFSVIDVESVAFTTTALFSRVVLVAFVCSKSLGFDVGLKKYPFVTEFVDEVELGTKTENPPVVFGTGVKFGAVAFSFEEFEVELFCHPSSGV
jgi:hypothetical protein